MGEKSVLHGPSRVLPPDVLLHEYFRKSVSENADRAKSNGLLFEGKFLSYAELNHRAVGVCRALRMRLRNRMKYDSNRRPCHKCRHQSSDDSETSDSVLADPPPTASSPVTIPGQRARLERLRGRLRSAPPAMSPRTLHPDTGSYDDSLPREAPVSPGVLDYQAACLVVVDVPPGPASSPSSWPAYVWGPPTYL